MRSCAHLIWKRRRVKNTIRLKYQPVLFCADSFEVMYETLRDYLVRGM